MSNVLLEDEFLAAARTLRANTEIRRAIDLEDAKAKAVIAAALAAGETGVDADGTELVKIQAGNKVWNEESARANLPAPLLANITISETFEQIDEDLARANLSEDVLASIVVSRTVERVDKVKAKNILAPALYDLCCKANVDTIKVL